MEFAGGFAGAGATVVINDRSREGVAAAGEGFRREGFDVDGCTFDVTDPETVDAAAGRIDILMNDAGIIRRAPLQEMKQENWNTVPDTDLTSAFIVSRVS